MKQYNNNIIMLFLCLFIHTTTSCQQSESIPKTNAAENSPLITYSISNKQVNAFAEDAQGHIWIGTFRGLNKFNIHEYQQYFCMDDSTSLPDNQIKDILRDSKGQLWISTVNGLCLYTDKDNFKRIKSDRPANNNAIQLLESKDGRIFLNYTSHLSVYNPDNETVECVIPQLDTKGSMNIKCFITHDNYLWAVSSEKIYCYDLTDYQLKDSFDVPNHPWYYHLTSDGMIWLTGKGVILLFDTNRHCFSELPSILANHSILPQSEITVIHPYASNSILLSTMHHGMFCYNFVENTIIHQKDEEFPFEAPDFHVSCMFTDSQQNLWIGSADQGYAVNYHYKKRFNNDNYLQLLFEKKSVVSVAAESDEILWISTLANGVYRYDLKKRKATFINIEKLFPESKDKDIRINQLFVDKADNTIWMTCVNNEVLKCRYTNYGLLVEARHNVDFPMSIEQDYNHNIWIGTATPYVYVIKKGKSQPERIKVFDIGTESSFTFIPGLLPIKNGKMLIAAFNKPLKFVNPENGEIEELMLDAQNMKTIIKRSVFIPTSIYEDSQGDVWIGTVSNGLLRYSPKDNLIQSLPGTACTDISGIEEDMQGNMWISTLYGLSKYERSTNQFTNYYEEDGIGGNQFYDRASCRLADGTIVFGGTHGLTLFNPADLLVRENIPLLFENLKIHNQLAYPGKDECIDKRLSLNPEIRLKHYQNGFSISYLALDYSEHERVRYYYKLEGFDKYWIDAHNNREAYYANLPSGKYTFRVRITNNQQHMIMAENAIPLIVEAAPWATGLAYTIYFIVATVLIGLFVRARISIRKEKAAKMQAEREKEQELWINKRNMSFFANVAHEFRTPLTMIAGPISQLCNSNDIDSNNKNLLHIVQLSVNRMLRLVNQLMDFNKLENDTLKLNVSHTDIIAELKRIVEIFDNNAKNKNINLITNGIEDSFFMWLDTDKIDKIITNLLSNALKFTLSGGEIELNFDLINGTEAQHIFNIPQENSYTKYIKIEVLDSGIGIPEDQLERIFERYYQLNNQPVGHYNWGTGIGLYYARSLARLHHGFLKASNRKDRQGSVFILILPTNDDAYSQEERVYKQVEQEKAYPLLPDTVTSESSINESSVNDKEKNCTKQKILVVDDDTEVVHYLQVMLSPTYHIICRFNAEDAFKAIREEAPDIVLSDVMMPGTDGYKLCRKIKEDLQICHTPVILVTAKTNLDEQVKGLNTGADAYVTKPFDPAYLQALIHSLLKNREKVRALLSRNTQVETIADNVLSPQDNAFMTELYKLMEKELSNSELDIVRITEKLHISRTKFYYKVKGLTGENPSIFFKTYKLNRAAELLKEGKYTISEIADMTGFSTHSYFSKAFKKQFNVAPSGYK